jgi:DNA replication protein DnaC
MSETINLLQRLALNGMATSLRHQLETNAFSDMAFEERVEVLAQAEASYRDNRRFDRMMKVAKLKVQAAPEKIEYRSGRGFTRNAMADLLTCTWITHNRNVLITGATGTGKTWLACALATQAARHGHSVLYRRTSRLLEEIAVARHDGNLKKLRSQLERTRVLVLDDFGLTPLTSQSRTDLSEVLDDRDDSSSTIIVGQMPVKDWHAFIGDAFVAEAILDRITNRGTRLELTGPSLRGDRSAKAAKA